MTRSPTHLARHRTFRWNDGQDTVRYAAVETRDDGLRWYVWSHGFGDGSGAQEILQTFEAFLEHGAPTLEGVPRALSHVVAALRSWIADER